MTRIKHFDISRRNLNRSLLGMGLAAVSPLGWAQGSYPTQPIRFVVPQPPGGTGDTVCRMVGQRLAARLGKPVVIENKAGAGGTLGAMTAAKSPADGYTIVLASPGFATFETMFPKLTSNPVSELTPVGMMGSVPIALTVRADSPYKTVNDLITHAKAHPGTVTYGSAGIGSLSHLMGAWFKSEARADVTHIPYSGTAPALHALVSGQVDIYFDPMAGVDLVKSGRLRVLATTGDKRSIAMPDAPTMVESGVPVRGSVWLGVMAPAGTPRPIIDLLNRELDTVLREPELKQQLETRLVYPDPMTVDQFSKFFSNEVTVWNRIVRENGIKPD